MKNKLLGLAMGLMMISGGLQAWDIVPIQDLHPEQMRELAEARLESLTVEVCEGLTVPVDLNFAGDILSTNGSTEEATFIEVKRTFFVECREEQHLFSWDQKDWYTLSEFSTGELRAIIDLRDGELRISLGGEIQSRIE